VIISLELLVIISLAIRLSGHEDSNGILAIGLLATIVIAVIISAIIRTLGFVSAKIFYTFSGILFSILALFILSN
jgi:hypothetical protein